MKTHGMLMIAGLFAFSFATFVAAQKNAPVKVEMHNAQGQDIGSATLSSAPQGVNINLELVNLPPGEHALHVHQNAKCDGPAFTTAGPHLNPDMKRHGLQNPDGPHAGDMPNFTVDAHGMVKATLVAPGVTLGKDSHSVFSNGGTALVIHAKADDQKTDPAGNAGDRIACGIVRK